MFDKNGYNATAPLRRVPLLKCRTHQQKKLGGNPPIAKIHANTTKHRSFQLYKRPQFRSVHYFTTGRKVNIKVLEELQKEKPAYVFPPIPTVGVPFNVIKRIESQHNREIEKHLTVSVKHSRKTKEMEHFAERVYVSPPLKRKFKMYHEKVAIDSQYFPDISGRPIKDKLSVKNYISEVRETFLNNLNRGFLQDEVYLIEEQQRNERKRIAELNELFENYYISFKEFEAHDHEEWLNIRRKADETSGTTSEMRNQLKQLMKELSQNRCSLYVLEEKWRNCKLCQIFLYQISPMSWQKEHPLTDSGGQEITSIKDMFERYKLDAEGSVQSLNELIEIFQEDIAAERGPPALYFTDPWQVILVFREMELQHLRSLLIIETVRKPNDVMKLGIHDVKTYYDAEIKAIKDQLEMAENKIKWEEERARMLEKTANNLQTELKELISSKDAILTHAFVEHAYEECVATGDTDMTALQTMEALTIAFEELMMKLDDLPSDAVKEAEAAVDKRNAIALDKAYKARRQVAILDNLTKSAKRALDKPFVRRGKPLMWRSRPPSPRQKLRLPSEVYSPKELEYLTHFTEYCKYDDEEVITLTFSLNI